jgi:hypothetical protein
MRAIGREISHSSSANTGHTTNRMPLGNRSAGRLVIGENVSLSRGCIIYPERPLCHEQHYIMTTIEAVLLQPVESRILCVS